MRIAKNTLLVLLGLIALIIGFVYFKVQQSLPILDGQLTSPQIKNPVSVERDKDGIPTIEASSREDASYALGYLHGQERFFQMDLLRRLSSGELSGLFGKKAFEKDAQIRVHRFRHRAKQAFATMKKSHQKTVTSYAQGVNDGLKDLGSAPWEYLLLGAKPQPWLHEDSFLTMFSMYISLQQDKGNTERTMGWLYENLPQDIAAFLTQKYSPFHSPLDDTKLEPVAFPSSKPDFSPKITESARWMPEAHYDPTGMSYSGDTGKLGSNNWAVSGNLTAHGSAMLAGDMHLGISAPNTWYRASIHYTDAKGKPWKVTGVTLPGTPVIISGSNRNVAWAFTNSYGDWTDVIKLDINEDGTQYRTADGYKPFIEHKERLQASKTTKDIIVKETIWGPVITEKDGKPHYAYRWVAHDPEGSNFNLFDFENALSITELSALANTIGVPAQNIAMVDKSGSVGWTIAGPIPKKQGNLGDVPVSWSDGSNAWVGYYDSEAYPRVMRPSHGRIWTANSRMIGGESLKKLGFGGYAFGARQQQIRDDLFAKDQFAEQDLLDIQLDDRALFMSRWHKFIMDNVLNDQAFIEKHKLANAKELMEKWGERASVESVGYNMARTFRQNIIHSIFATLDKRMAATDKELAIYHIRNRIEEPVWQIINRQPEAWLPNSSESWNAYFQTVFLKTVDGITNSQRIALQDATWGAENSAYIRHPLSVAVPFIGRFIDMPDLPQAGDSFMPRVAYRAFGASQRTVVSPGHEEEGIFHMPAGQSGHPFSPYFGNGHLDWLHGKPSPFLPGAAVYKLTFAPDSQNGNT